MDNFLLRLLPWSWGGVLILARPLLGGRGLLFLLRWLLWNGTGGDRRWLFLNAVRWLCFWIGRLRRVRVSLVRCRSLFGGLFGRSRCLAGKLMSDDSLAGARELW